MGLPLKAIEKLTGIPAEQINHMKKKWHKVNGDVFTCLQQ